MPYVEGLFVIDGCTLPVDGPKYLPADRSEGSPLFELPLKVSVPKVEGALGADV